MKQLLIIAAFFFTLGVVKAQPSKPYWVIETNINKTNFTILRIYDSQNSLLHEALLKGKALNISSRRDRKRVDRKVKEILKHQAFVPHKK